MAASLWGAQGAIMEVLFVYSLLVKKDDLRNRNFHNRYRDCFEFEFELDV